MNSTLRHRLLIILIGLCLLAPFYAPPLAQAAIANPRNTALTNVYATAISASFATLPSSGSHVCVQLAGFASTTNPTSFTIADNQGVGNTYAQSVYLAGTRFTMIGCTTATIGATSGTFTVTATAVGSVGTVALQMVAREYTGLASGNPLDVVASGSGTTTTLDTTATATTAQAEELLLYSASVASNSATTTYTENVSGSAPSSGWTEDFTDADDTNALTCSFGSVIVASTVAARHVITVSTGGNNTAVVATLKGASAPAPDVTKFRLRLNQ